MAQETTEKQTIRRLIDQIFTEPVEIPAKSLLYRLGLLLTTLTTISLPALYVLSIIGLAFGLFRYNDILHEFFQSLTLTDLNQEIYIAPRWWFLYIPMIFGWLIIVFLLRPLVPRRQKKKETSLYDVNQDTEPLLYFFIEQICEHIHAPVPKHIELVMKPEISVTLKRGLFSFLSGNLTLSIGLPLLSGLTVRQFAGILTHELAYFRQKGAVRLFHLNFMIHDWFARNVHDDQIDEDPDWETSGMHYGRMTFHQLYLVFIFFAKILILLVRGILALFMLLAAVVGSFFSRQMVYEADQLQIRVAGSRDFEATLYAATVMQKAFSKTDSMTYLSRRKSVLVNDLPMLIKEEAKEIVARTERKKNMIDSLLAEETKMQDMKPVLRDRIGRARKLQLPGICKIAIKSRVLLDDYDSLCKKLTRLYYQNIDKGLADKMKYLNVEEYQDFVLELQSVFRRVR